MNTNIAEEIKKLKELLDQGALTQQEFEEAKKKILAQDAVRPMQTPPPMPQQIPPQQIPPQQLPPQQVPPQQKSSSGCGTAFLIVFLVFLFLGGIFLAWSSCSSSRTPSSSSSAVSTESGATESIVSELSAEEKKSRADAFDTEVWSQTVELIKKHNNICQHLVDYADGKASALDVYNYCEDVNDSLVTWNVAEATTENEKSYAKNVETFALYVQEEAKLVMDYMDNPTASALSKVEESIQTVTNGISSIAQTRGTFLGSEGFTDEEIAAKIEKIDEELQ